jgi:hypothetical protein
MILLYSWKQIYRHSQGSSKRIISILSTLILKLQKKYPQNKRGKVYKDFYFIDFSGHSFLRNPEPLINYRYKWRDKDIAQYIGLASFRNFAEFQATGKVTLDLLHCPLKRDAIINNKLLRIKDDNIHFLYEDYNQENI